MLLNTNFQSTLLFKGIFLRSLVLFDNNFMLISQQKKNYDYFKGMGHLYFGYFDSPNQVNFDWGGGQRHPKWVFDAPQFRSDGQDGKL